MELVFEKYSTFGAKVHSVWAENCPVDSFKFVQKDLIKIIGFDCFGRKTNGGNYDGGFRD